MHLLQNAFSSSSDQVKTALNIYGGGFWWKRQQEMEFNGLIFCADAMDLS